MKYKITYNDFDYPFILGEDGKNYGENLELLETRQGNSNWSSVGEEFFEFDYAIACDAVVNDLSENAVYESGYYILDSNFQKINQKGFENVWPFTINPQLLEVVTEDLHYFVDVVDNQIVPLLEGEGFKSISECNNYYIVENQDGSFSLINNNLQKLNERFDTPTEAANQVEKSDDMLP